MLLAPNSLFEGISTSREVDISQYIIFENVTLWFNRLVRWRHFKSFPFRLQKNRYTLFLHSLMENLLPSKSILLQRLLLSMHSMMWWNLTSKKFPTETECGVWKLILCSFTYQSQKNPIP